MKTATINVYHVWGTSRTTAADVLYRGRALRRFCENASPQTLLDQARNWAHANGFTHTKIIYG